MLTAAGVLIIVAAMTAAGNGFAGLLKKRLASLSALIGLLESLEIKIREFNTPIKEFFRVYAGDESMKKLCSTAHTDGLLSAVKLHSESLALDLADTLILCEFAESLGTLSALEEEKRCRLAREKLIKNRDELKEKLPVKMGLFKSAGIMCGILAAVLLI